MATKTLPHQNCSSSQPPAIGPTATPRPVIAPQIPMARARSSRSVYRLEMIDSVAGKISAAPTPITARTATSAVGVSTSPPTADAVPNTASPDSSAPLRPKRSPRLPPASTSAANVRRYASTTHCSSLVVAPSSRTSDGSVTLTIVVSRLIVNAARHSTARAAPRREVFVPVMDKKLKCTDRKVKRFLIGFQA